MAEPGDVNNFRSNFEKLYREYMQQRPAALPGGGSGGPPATPGGRDMASMPEGPGAQPGGRTYYSNVPSTNVRPPIDLSEVSRARPMGGALGPSALAGLGALAQYLQQGPNPFGATLLPQRLGFSSQTGQAPMAANYDPPVHDAMGNYIGRQSEISGVRGYDTPEMPRDISPIPEERGRDTGQNYGPARPQARPQRRAAQQPPTDPRFAQLLQSILSQPQAAPQAAPVPHAPALRPGPGLTLDPMMGGGNA
jgi:hypothetical protein